jgi:hypothetical protein
MIQIHHNFNLLIYVLLKQASCFHAMYFSSFLAAGFHFVIFQAIYLYYTVVNINFMVYLCPVLNFECLMPFTAIMVSLNLQSHFFSTRIKEVYCLFGLEAVLYLNNFLLRFNFRKLVNFE